VTELVARPLINMYWPQLAGFVQPLGGEYAARRALLETLPFPCGYGVELGLLIDTLAAVGLDAMAQVDLARRKHRNSSTVKLGRMAAEIWQVALDRLERDGRLTQSAPPLTVLSQFERSGDGYLIVDADVTEHERPPMVTLRT
jgi:glucosyl-3-phosphoglycerate synthase